jgi:hypothetical protein
MTTNSNPIRTMKVEHVPTSEASFSTFNKTTYIYHTPFDVGDGWDIDWGWADDDIKVQSWRSYARTADP